MNKNVLRTMIILCWVFLALYAVLKLVPQLASKFVIVVNNEKIVKVGQFIDERVWLQQMVHFVFALLTYHLYLCACCKVWHLSFKQYIISLAFILPNQVLTFFYPQIGSNIAFVIMFCLPCAFKADYKTVAIIFATHILGQLGISFIRSAELYMMNMNTISQIIMCIDQYVWLLLYYLYSNLYKENVRQQYAPHLDKSDFYAIANMVYSDYYNPRFDTNTYVQLAIDWLDDKDVGGNKTLKYYMKVVK